jgi:hypothetical protein
VLSFDTVHALTDCLIRLQADDRCTPAAAPELLGTLMLAQDNPAGSPHGHLRQLRTLYVPLLAGPQLHHTLPAALHHVADALSGTAHTAPPDGPLSAADLTLLHAQLRNYRPGLRLLAWAVCYDDVRATPPHGLTLLRRVDAVDADGRVYQLSRRPDETQPTVTLDDRPNPGDLPATYPPLAQLATSTPSGANPRP